MIVEAGLMQSYQLPGEQLLEQVNLFKDLQPEQRRWLTRYFGLCQFPTCAVIFKQDAPAEYFYILLAGEVLVRFKPYDGSELTVARIHPGEVFGWSAVLGNTTYTASAASTENCQMLRMRGSDLHRLCRETPETGSKILEALAAAAGEGYGTIYSQVIALIEYGLCNSADIRRQEYGDADG
jgi:CRP-like cAMP-binding protein